jgi:H+/Cl- antiporter ClcA
VPIKASLACESSLRTTPSGPGAITLPRMRRRLHVADLVALLILGVFVGVFGTGLGVAAAHVRSTSSPERTPLRAILRPGAETPSLQRDRVRFHAPAR